MKELELLFNKSSSTPGGAGPLLDDFDKIA